MLTVGTRVTLTDQYGYTVAHGTVVRVDDDAPLMPYVVRWDGPRGTVRENVDGPNFRIVPTT